MVVPRKRRAKATNERRRVHAASDHDARQQDAGTALEEDEARALVVLVMHRRVEVQGADGEQRRPRPRRVAPRNTPGPFAVVEPLDDLGQLVLGPIPDGAPRCGRGSGGFMNACRASCFSSAIRRPGRAPRPGSPRRRRRRRPAFGRYPGSGLVVRMGVAAGRLPLQVGERGQDALADGEPGNGAVPRESSSVAPSPLSFTPPA